jgi:hypothetical protein
MAKEKVIIFQGEDKFVTPRAHTFDLGTGVKEFVAVDGPGKGDERDPTSNIPPLNSGSQNDRNPISNIGDDGGRSGRVVGLPMIGEPDYCNKLQNFITTRGYGNATPDQIMAAHDMFKRGCREADPTTTTTTAAPTPPPPQNTPPPPPPPKTEVVVPVIPVGNLGVPPISMGGGFGGGGGGEEGAPAPKKKSYWWLLLVAVGIYYVAKKKN